MDLKDHLADNLLTPCHPRCPRHSVFSRKEIKVFDENIPGFSPYNELQWAPNGSMTWG